jgi:Domain of unknown function (DUF4136)
VFPRSNPQNQALADFPSAVYVQKGTLVIEIVDARSRKILWRGTATGNLDTTPSKALKGINRGSRETVQGVPR